MSSVTSVGTSVNRVIPDKYIPNSAKTGLTISLLTGGELVDNILEEMVNGLGVKAGRAYEYARDGGYPFGLPSGQFTNGAAGTAQVEAVLSAQEGLPVLIDYVRYGVPNSLHVAWMAIQAVGYNPNTNQFPALTAAKGTSVYLEDMIVVVPPGTLTTLSPQMLEQWGASARSGYAPSRAYLSEVARMLLVPTPVQADPAATEVHVLVQYVWRVAGVDLYDTFTVPVSAFPQTSRYFHARYSVGGTIKYWMYKDGVGTYPALDGIFERAPTSNGSFFPFLYFRQNSQSVIADKTTAEYRASKKLAKYLGMDYEEVAMAVDASPDIASVQQAVMMFAVPGNSTNQVDLRYLWTFFNNVFLAQDAENQFRSPEEHVFAANETYSGVAQLGVPSKSVIIQDTRFKMSINHSGIYKKRVAGSIGPVGTYSNLNDAYIYYVAVQGMDNLTEYQDFPVRRQIYRHQVSKGFYDQIIITDLQTQFYVNNEYSVIADEADNILLIPLDFSITQTYSIPDREVLYARSMQFVFNALVVTKLRWYQEDLFQFVLLAIAVYSVMTSFGTTANAVSALLAAGAYSAAAVVLINVVLRYLVFAYLFKLFVKAVGVEVALVVALVAAAAGLYNSEGATEGLAGAPFAGSLLQLSNGLVQGVSAYNKDRMDDLLDERKSFEAEQAEKQRLLKTANQLLENDFRLNPLVIFGESPQEFYNRTAHSGNIGIVGIDAISTYVDSALTLPKLNETLGAAYAAF